MICKDVQKLMTTPKIKVPKNTQPQLNYGQMLKNLRVMRELSCAELAKACNVSRAVIYALETNQYPPSRAMAAKLATVLGTHPGIIMFPTWPE